MRRIFLFYFFTHLKFFLNDLNVLLYRFKKKEINNHPKFPMLQNMTVINSVLSSLLNYQISLAFGMFLLSTFRIFNVNNPGTLTNLFKPQDGSIATRNSGACSSLLHMKLVGVSAVSHRSNTLLVNTLKVSFLFEG